jgi:hypothetical protein
MYFYKLRIDSTDKALLRKVPELYATEYVLCFENFGTSNPHAHYYIESEIEHTTIRMFIRKTFGAGNGVYSLKSFKKDTILTEGRPLEYLAYLCKEGEYEQTEGIDLTEALAYDEKVKNDIQEKKKKAKQTVFQEMESDYKESDVYKFYMDTIGENSGLFLNQGTHWQQLVAWIIDWHITRDKQIQEFRIKSYAETLACKHHYYTPFMAHKIAKNF